MSLILSEYIEPFSACLIKSVCKIFDVKVTNTHCCSLAKNDPIRKSFCLAAENLLHEKKNLLSEFIYCMCHQTYTKDAIVLCRLKLLNMELSEICDTIFDQAILTISNFRNFNNTKYNVKFLILA